MLKKKTKLIVPIILAIIVFITALAPTMSAYAEQTAVGYEPRLTAPNSSIPYYSTKLNVYFQTGSGMPNCVAYAYGRVYEMNGEAPLITHGSAGDWYGINKANGYYDYGQEPKVGAVACWSRHVAVVEKIHDNGDITISESHWGGGYFDTRRYDNMFSHFGQTFYGYIYTYNEEKAIKKEREKTMKPGARIDFRKIKLDKKGKKKTKHSVLYDKVTNRFEL